MKRVLLFLFSCLSACPVFSQLYNGDNITIQSGASVYLVNTGYINKSNGRIDLKGTIEVLGGNWKNEDGTTENIVTNSGGLVRIRGTLASQKVFGIRSTAFTNLEVNNSLGVDLDTNVTVSEVLTFTAGKIRTNDNLLTITSTAPGAMTGYNNTKYVVGTLRRYVDRIYDYDYPIGDASNYELASFHFKSMTGVNYITGNFTTAAIASPPHDPASNTIYVFPNVMNPVADPAAIYNHSWSFIWEFLNKGYWTFTPDAVTSPLFMKLTLTETGQTNGGTMGQQAVIKRDNGSSPWRAEGYYPFGSQSGSGTDPVTAYMDSLKGFGDFILGKAMDGWGPLGIVLLDFDASCEQGRVNITWSTANEENNDYFTIERSRDGLYWEEVGKVPGSRQSSGTLSYHLTDPNPYPGKSYYRMKQTDVDGTTVIMDETWTQLVVCEKDDFFSLHFYCDETNWIHVNFDTPGYEKFTVSLYDAVGNLVASRAGESLPGLNQVSFIQPASQGVYLLTFRSAQHTCSRKVLLNSIH